MPVKAEDIEKRLRTELDTKAPSQSPVPENSYSEDYKSFRKDQFGKTVTRYERWCALAEHVIGARLKPEKRKEIKQYLELTHLNINPEATVALSYLAAFFSIVATIVVFFFITNLFVIFAGIVLAIIFFFYLKQLPKLLFDSWRSKASDQLLLAVLYIIIYMKQESNLERAIYFVSKNIPPPLSLDFMKVLWDFESGKFSTIQESLETYIKNWQGREDAFVDAIHLIEASLHESSRRKADELLDKANNVLVEGINDGMLHYAHNLQSPIKTVHMLGIVLPVMVLVMMPMISAFMGNTIKAEYLFFLYNVSLPLLVFFLSKNILSKRPAGASSEAPELFKLGRKHKIGVRFISVMIFLLFAAPFSFLMFNASLRGKDFFNAMLLDPLAFYLSVLFIAGLGFAIAINNYLSISKVYKLKKKVDSIESSFSAAIYQLGSRIGQNIPAEEAFRRMEKETTGSVVAEFFSAVNANIQQAGMSLREAIFNEKSGAITLYPSSIIRSFMTLLVESVKKSPQITADALTTLSRYLQDANRVIKRLKDLLADTVSDMDMQAKFYASIIAGIVVSLSILITNVLLSLSNQLEMLTETSTSEVTGIAFGAGLTTFFSVEEIIAPPVFQIIIGLYVIQIVILLSYLLSGVKYGFEDIERKYLTAKNLFYAVALYTVLTLISSWMFAGLAEVVTQTGLGL